MADRLKDTFFTSTSVAAFADSLGKQAKSFDKSRFIGLVLTDEFRELELKQMMRHTTECLHKTLPSSYGRSIKILMKAAPEIGGFEAMCLPDFVEVYGQDDWDLSMQAMALFTKYSSSEFAIRPFIELDVDRAMEYLVSLAADEDPRVRRFASEGCRPRLPWAKTLPQFIADPSPVLLVLEKLKDDESESVRKSVANNLNDISKDHPELVLSVCEGWQGTSDRTDWIIKHACRTMLKAGNRRAMQLFDFADPKRIDVTALRVGKKTLHIGDKLVFSFILNLKTKTELKVRLEYVVVFAKARGKTGKKVFKISENTYAPGEHTLKKRHSFEDLSTRKHYPGRHELAIIVNGVEKARTFVTLK